MIDHNVYPHIVDLAVAFSDHNTLLNWRATARRYWLRVDKELFRHVVVEPLPSPGLFEFLAPSGNRLPVLPELLEALCDRSKFRQACQLLTKTTVFDILGRHLPFSRHLMLWAGDVLAIPVLRAMTRAISHSTFRFVSPMYDITAVTVIPCTTLSCGAVFDLIHALGSTAQDAHFSMRLVTIPPSCFWYVGSQPPKRFVLNIPIHPTSAHQDRFPRVTWPNLLHVSTRVEYVFHFSASKSQPVNDNPSLHPSYICATSDSPPTLRETIGILSHFLMALYSQRLASFCFVGLDKLPNSAFGLARFGLSSDWPTRREALMERFREKARTWKFSPYVPAQQPADTVLPSFLTRDEYREQVGEERFVAETVIPVSRGANTSGRQQ